jgi:alpha-tubulin suppressor-like RCC1 family protein
MCWGDNGFGELGVSTAPALNSDMPLSVKSLPPNATAVSSGAYHTCALLPASVGGDVACWGDNHEGQIGNGQMGAAPVSSPASVSGLTDAIAIAAGRAHSCAIQTDGSVVCWGNDADGELGDGMTMDSDVPVPTGAKVLPTARAISAGDYHTCVLANDASVWCWGLNDHGQLGIAGMTEHGPSKVQGLPDVKAVSAGDSYTCALTTAGHVLCWGDNAFGQLGNDSTMDSPTPVQVKEN